MKFKLGGHSFAKQLKRSSRALRSEKIFKFGKKFGETLAKRAGSGNKHAKAASNRIIDRTVKSMFKKVKK